MNMGLPCYAKLRSRLFLTFPRVPKMKNQWGVELTKMILETQRPLLAISRMLHFPRKVILKECVLLSCYPIWSYTLEYIIIIYLCSL